MSKFPLHALFASLALIAALAFVAAEANAAPRFNSGSRGTRTYTAPPSTATAPGTARPLERSATQPSTAARPATPATQPGGLFNRPGLLGGLAAGFLGAGLIGLLLGHGFMGGLAGLASIFGLLLQVGLIVVIGALLWRWFQRRSQPATAFAGGPAMRDAGAHGDANMASGGIGSGVGGANTRTGGGVGFGGANRPAPVVAPLEIKPADFDAFEKLLGEIHTAYGREDVAALRANVTPEMLSYYSEELAQNQSRGVVNQISDIKLLQGDLSEAWREDGDEYATVAMRYALNDRYVDRASGRVVEQGPGEATELWTFRRANGGAWVLSAIQQTS